MSIPSRQAFLNNRKNGIGGSDAAAILGISPWRTQVDVWIDKVSHVLDFPCEDNPTLRQELGTFLEDKVVDLYERETESKCRRHNKQLSQDCIIGNVDRLVCVNGKFPTSKGEVITPKILECKTTSKDWNGEVPDYYVCQCLQYIGLLPSVQTCDVAVLQYSPSLNFNIYTIERDDEAINSMFELEREFWARFVQPTLDNPDLPTPPAPQNEEDCKAVWSVRKNKATTPMMANENDLSLIREIKELDAHIESLNKEKSDLRTSLISRMVENGVNEIATLDESGKQISLLSWKQTKDRITTDWKNLVKTLNVSNEVLSKFQTQTAGSFVFRIK